MDIRKVLTDSGVSLFRKIILFARGILVVPIITKLLGVDIYGIWTLIFSFIAIFGGVGGLHLHGTLVRYTPTEDTEGQTVSDLLLIALFTAAIAGFTFPLLIEYVGFSTPAKSVLGLSVPVIAAMIVVAKIIGSILKNIPRAENRVKKFELISLAEKTLETVALLTVLTVTQNIAAGLLAILGSMVVVYTAILLLYIPGRIRKPEPDNFRRYLSYSTPMIFKDFSNQMLSHTDKFVILYFFSPAQVGIYSVAYGVSVLFPTLTSMFNSTLYPSVTSAWENDEMADVKRFYRNFLEGYVLLVIPVLFGITLLASPILRLLATERVATEGWILVPILTFGFVFRGYENVITYVLNAAEATEKVAIGTSLAFLTNLVLNLALVPAIGIEGAAVAMMISMIVRMAYVYYHVRSYVSLPIPKRRVVKAVFSSAIMVALLLYIGFNPDREILKLVLYPVVGATTYFAVVFIIGGLTAQDIRRMKSML